MTGMKEAEPVDHKLQEQISLHRWAVIAEAAGPNLTPAERGALARRVAARPHPHPHPDGSPRTYSRGTIDRWLRAWRAGGVDALKPPPRSGTRDGRARIRSCSPRLARCGWSCLAGPRRRSPRSCGTAMGSRCPSGPCGDSCAGPGCTARRWLPSRRSTEGMRRPRRTSGGSPTCSSGRGCRSRSGTGQHGQAVLDRG